MFSRIQRWPESFWNPAWLRVTYTPRLTVERTLSASLRLWSAVKTDHYQDNGTPLLGTRPRRAYYTKTRYLKIGHWLFTHRIVVTFQDLRDSKEEVDAN